MPLPFKLVVPSLGCTIITAGGQATPMTYADSSGKQYVLVVAGGPGSLGTRTGDAVIAYSLP